MRAVYDSMIIAPPLIISRAELDELIGIARSCLDQTLLELKRRKLI
jgi:putrescine aminotransferase